MVDQHIDEWLKEGSTASKVVSFWPCKSLLGGRDVGSRLRMEERRERGMAAVAQMGSRGDG